MTTPTIFHTISAILLFGNVIPERVIQFHYNADRSYCRCASFHFSVRLWVRPSDDISIFYLFFGALALN